MGPRERLITGAILAALLISLGVSIWYLNARHEARVHECVGLGYPEPVCRMFIGR